VEEARPEAEAATSGSCPTTKRVRSPSRESLHARAALANLVDNAIKYGGEGKEVRVRGRRAGEDLVLEVIDQGPGIPPAHLGRLFERFYRVDRGRSRELGGTGSVWPSSSMWRWRTAGRRR